MEATLCWHGQRLVLLRPTGPCRPQALELEWQCYGIDVAPWSGAVLIAAIRTASRRQEGVAEPEPCRASATLQQMVESSSDSTAVLAGPVPPAAAGTYAARSGRNRKRSRQGTTEWERTAISAAREREEEVNGHLLRSRHPV